MSESPRLEASLPEELVAAGFSLSEDKVLRCEDVDGYLVGKLHKNGKCEILSLDGQLICHISGVEKVVIRNMSFLDMSLNLNVEKGGTAVKITKRELPPRPINLPILTNDTRDNVKDLVTEGPFRSMPTRELPPRPINLPTLTSNPLDDSRLKKEVSLGLPKALIDLGFTLENGVLSYKDLNNVTIKYLENDKCKVTLPNRQSFVIDGVKELYHKTHYVSGPGTVGIVID